MSSQTILYSKGKNDEMYTPEYAVIPVLEYIKKDWVVWCPFDKKNSEFVKQISKKNKVIFSHIDDGQDFFTYEPKEHYDAIISNPPFTKKRQIFERALSFGKPIALLMSNTWLNDKYSKWVFYEKDKDMQLLMFNKRIEYFDSKGITRHKITFSSSYYCNGILPKGIVLKKIL